MWVSPQIILMVRLIFFVVTQNNLVNLWMYFVKYIKVVKPVFPLYFLSG